MTFQTRWAAGITALAAASVKSRLLSRFTTPECLLDETTSDEEVRRALDAPGAGFVTLTKDGRLRGCIGNVTAIRPLYKTVVHHARQAMTDPRMAPVTIDEWPHLAIEVSVLSQPEAMDAVGRAEVTAALRPGIDGLILRQGDRRATFLPSVWKTLTTPDRFVAALLAKGGWDDWPSDMTAARYGTESFTDHPPRPHLEAP